MVTSVPPGVPAIETDEISFDPTTCQMVVQSGVPSPLPPDAESPGTGAAPAAAYQISAGYSHQWVQDFAGIHVNDVYTHVKWKWNGTNSYFYPSNPPLSSNCGSNGSCGTSPMCYDNTSHAPDGWSLDNSHSINCNRPADLTRVESATYAAFTSEVFCVGIDTHVVYNRARARGWNNGALADVWNFTISGGCASLLSFHQEVVRTIN
jgi:hypothetical protein